MQSILKKLYLLPIVLALSACSALPKSDYKEVNSSSNKTASTKEINICRDGSISDNTFILVYFDNEFITYINNSAYSKSNIKILYEHPVNNLNFIARSAKDRQAGSLNLKDLSYKRVNILIESKTTDAKLVPLPFIVFFGTSGERKLRVVNNVEFEEACGNVTQKVYSK
jgi:hypothetical protein